MHSPLKHKMKTHKMKTHKMKTHKLEIPISVIFFRNGIIVEI